jgi:ornithine--oxo-acid transaminase
MNESLFCQAILMPLLTEHHILAQVAGHRLDVIKLIPALVLSKADADRIVAALDETTRACSKFPGPAWEALRRIGANTVRKPSRGVEVKRERVTT